MRYCENCGNQLNRREQEKLFDFSKRRFCDNYCSAKYRGARRRFTGSIPNTTKHSLFLRCSSWQSARSLIRKHAEKVVEYHEIPEVCCVCGYDAHVEICHIKSVSSFSGDSTISEINDIDNLVLLCPNHHWEFDNGLPVL